jgi:hypothetical protein
LPPLAIEKSFYVNLFVPSEVKTKQLTVKP